MEDTQTITKELTLEIKNLVVEYRTHDGTVHALNGMYLEIEKGQTHGLVGETGAGKTTAGLSVLRLISSPPGVAVDGVIRLNGELILDKTPKTEQEISENTEVDAHETPILEKTPQTKPETLEADVQEKIQPEREKTEREMQQIRGKVASMIFQDPMTSLNPVLTVEDQIAEVIEHHEKVSYKQSIEKAREMLELVGIPGSRGTDFPHQFSGGMKQRVVIAMALACNPGLLIADEPTTALDVTIQAQVLEMMKDLREKYDTSMLMITHDLGIVAEICDVVSVVYAGRVVEHGTLEDIFDNTRHPYTEGLFNSLPNLRDRKAKLRPIKGLMPDPSNLPTGCPFHPRCDYATEICSQQQPKKIYRTERHYTECHLYNSENIVEGKVIRR